MKSENAKAQLRKGVLEMCILAIIAKGEAYPSDIIEQLKVAQLIVVEGTLYPLLTRLKNDGLLQYTWRESRSGPPRKYFQITEEGEVFLAELQTAWDELVLAVSETFQFSNPQNSIPDEQGI
jgi:PadR family transcriptional regulator PadR